MRNLTHWILAIVVTASASTCYAQDGQKKRRNGQGKPQANNAQAGNGLAARNRPGQGGGMDPARIVARMMQEFDKDGDQKLNMQELTALLTTMRERGRGGAGQGMVRPGQGRTRPGENGDAQKRQGRPDGAGKKRRGNANAQEETSGGQKPVRPDGT